MISLVSEFKILDDHSFSDTNTECPVLQEDSISSSDRARQRLDPIRGCN